MLSIYEMTTTMAENGRMLISEADLSLAMKTQQQFGFGPRVQKQTLRDISDVCEFEDGTI